jgi:hypothetical protein
MRVSPGGEGELSQREFKLCDLRWAAQDGWLIAKFVMPGLVPGIHVLSSSIKEDVDGRDKPGHDGPIAAMPPQNQKADRSPLFCKIVSNRWVPGRS